MTQAKVVHVFDESADQLWELIGDVEKWSTGGTCVQEGQGVGALRTITMDDGRVIVDRLLPRSRLRPKLLAVVRLHMHSPLIRSNIAKIYLEEDGLCKNLICPFGLQSQKSFAR